MDTGVEWVTMEWLCMNESNWKAHNQLKRMIRLLFWRKLYWRQCRIRISFRFECLESHFMFLSSLAGNFDQELLEFIKLISSYNKYDVLANCLQLTSPLHCTRTKVENTRSMVDRMRRWLNSECSTILLCVDMKKIVCVVGWTVKNSAGCQAR